jgi:N-acetylglucosaminyl-diphospho-decaprenol L-rhamnosyltransferase
MNNKQFVYLVVTCNGEATISKLLDSIPPQQDIFIIDNDSRDSTKAIIRDRNIVCIENTRNIGYGAAINQGLKILQERYEFVVVLNQDIILQKFQPVISSLSPYAIIQPLILLPTGQVNVTTLSMNMFGYVYPPDFGHMPGSQKVRESFFFSGAAFILNVEKWKKIGCFDESLFLYYEDIDYALRVFLAGEKILFDPSLTVTHIYHHSFTQKEKRVLLSVNRKKILTRYLPPLWRRLIFVPRISQKENVSDQQKWKIASQLLPMALLGFYTKQIPGWKRLFINLLLVPYSYVIRWILKRLTPRL